MNRLLFTNDGERTLLSPRLLDGENDAGQRGFALLGVIVAMALILLILSVAAPRVARELRRAREVETVNRGNQYIRAIQLYYRKFGHYPASIDQLEGTNNIRFLRKRFIDPLTGKDDWRPIRIGMAKTTVKGLFGRPLAGVAPGLDSAASFGQHQGGAAEGDSAAQGIGSPSSDTGEGAPLMGVGVAREGASILTVNGQATYETWEFIYDARIEQLKQNHSPVEGSPALANGVGLGSTPLDPGSAASMADSSGRVEGESNSTNTAPTEDNSIDTTPH